MNKAKLKVLVRALKEIVEELEWELYADAEAENDTPPFSASPHDYDEVVFRRRLYVPPGRFRIVGIPLRIAVV